MGHPIPKLADLVSSQKIGAFSEPDRFWKPVGFFPELLSIYLISMMELPSENVLANDVT